MTPEIALHLAKQIAHNYPNYGYDILFRHFLMRPAEIITIKASRDVWILAQDTASLRVVSTAGLYDLSETRVSELQYIHQGAFSIQNTATGNPNSRNSVRFIQIIFKPKKHE